ncbi:MAG TPA: glycosyltransferase family 10 [Solirubrobacteraceae bacterium]
MPDYVSDKLFDVWVAGSVPVYLGATNVAEFAPARNSYIDASSFDSPAELAAYLNHLDGHDDDY